MDFIASNFKLIMFVSIAVFIFFTVRMLGTPKGHKNERIEYITNKVESIGGTFVEAEKVKKSDCPLNEELGLNQDIVYIPYKVVYEIDNRREEGWAINVVSGTLVSYAVTENKWIMRL